MKKNIKLFKVFMPPKKMLLKSLSDVLYSGQISHGKVVDLFEQEFSNLIGVKNSVSFNSCTAALHAAMIIADIKYGDEVISTAMTAEPTNMAVLYSGAKLVWADVDINNGNIDPKSIESKITPNTKAIVVVHYSGIPVRLSEIRKIASDHNLFLIEDAAQAMMSKYDRKYIGNICGDNNFVVFSFQAIKHMNTGDGGMLCCSEKFVEHAKKIRWFGMDRSKKRIDDDIQRIGFKYNMNCIAAQIGREQLKYIVKNTDICKDNGCFFNKEFDKIGINRAKCEDIAQSSFWMYTIIVDDRDNLIKKLKTFGIESSIAHKRNDWHSLFKTSATFLPNLDVFYSKMLHIPCGSWVCAADREYILEIIKTGW